ncbi:hypothetical protein BCV72DRAFT_74768 [Rhizopus microsporus var. microsporus]|uniref:SRR1-like domain-containing protein n=2 Tax=Rhizopus microsporus TaxID=58291 RepID=A0A2G4T5V7_RHIZD|nr:uncharacterized protein RHIMIDRAFT_61484 [Rhizopus microsporus ATCC 52813]ORE08964.1 hypothetical protein BCV72DRAFT_74768 [Rhizopus microsporus var. microsporus]PHZ16404.1 hypothetical protein RHIMIDRAFT_61484 [Rhizopus microsporus ATCC 52813]
MTDQSDQDGFTTVERFKYKKVSKKKRNKYTFKDPDDYTIDDLEAKLKERREFLENSRFYKELLDIFKEHLLSCKFNDIVCYGIGSMQKSKNAQYQFILALILRDLLNIPGKMYIFDPVMTELDKELCAIYKLDIIQENEQGKRAVEQSTLFYMPHCGRGLYSNTLSANWTARQLPLITIIGNRFDMYVGSQLEKDLIRECPFLIPATDILKMVAFPKEFDNNQIFNDLSIQTFPKETVRKIDDSFWLNVIKDS